MLFKDIRYAIRSLLKRPGFTAVVVLLLALGIGANTAIFSLLDAVLLRMLPVQHAEQLVEVSRTSAQGLATGFSYPAFQQFRDRNRVFSEMLAVSKTPLRTTDDSSGEAANGQYVSGNYFSLLGVRVQTGRPLVPEDDQVSNGGGAPVAVISYRFWQRRFGGDSSVVGKPIAVEGKPFAIVGVTPPEFFGLQVGSAPDFWIPIATEPLLRPKSWLGLGNYNWLSVVGRLKPGVSSDRARADLDLIFTQVLTESSSGSENEHDRREFLSQKIQVTSASNGLSRLRQQFSKPLLILMVVVALVLLIACANIANLLLARATSRRREFAVRLALGASRYRLIRQLLTESLLLSFLGGLAGLLLAFWGSSFLVHLMSSSQTPIELELGPNLSVLAFAAMASLLTNVVFGVVPALRATRINVNDALKENSLSVSGSRSGAVLGKALVVSQVALSLVLVIGAGLFVRSLRNLKTLDAGFDRDNVLLAGVNPGKAGYEDTALANFYRRVLEQTRQIPGVQSSSFSMLTPISGGGVDYPASVEGHAAQPNEDPTVYVNSVSPKYFETLGTPLLLGRDFSEQDGANMPRVAVINETMMNYYFRGTDPIGRRVTLGSGQPMTIIGVVKDAKYMSLRESAHRTVYKNCMQDEKIMGSLTLEVRTIGNPERVVNALRKEVDALASNVPLTGLHTLAGQVDQSLIQERMMATLSGFFGLLALLLACVGLYGVMSHNVARRTREIGIRMALGAQRADMIRMVLRESLVLVALGIAIGMPIALAATRLAASQISGLLFGLSATDARTIGLAMFLLTGITMLAACLPARRATKVDPLVALRYE
jgi:predicted permease